MAQKGKWESEYDKVEAELMRRHLGETSSTITMNLRMLGRDVAAWDTTLPADEFIHVSVPKKRKKKYVFCHMTQNESPERYCKNEHRDSVPSEPRKTPQMYFEGSPYRPLDHRYLSDPFGLLHVKPSELVTYLRVLTSPPVRFKQCLQMDMTGIDLEWAFPKVHNHYAQTNSGLSGEITQPVNTLTLHQFRRDLKIRSGQTSSTDEIALNSPRSALVLFSNGVTVPELQHKSVELFLKISDSREVAELRYAHHEARCSSMLDHLQAEYSRICQHVSSQDILEALKKFSAMEMRYAGTQDVLQTQHEHQKKIQLHNMRVRERREHNEREAMSQRERLRSSEATWETKEQRLQELRRQRDIKNAEAREKREKRLALHDALHKGIAEKIALQMRDRQKKAEEWRAAFEAKQAQQKKRC